MCVGSMQASIEVVSQEIACTIMTYVFFFENWQSTILNYHHIGTHARQIIFFLNSTSLYDMEILWKVLHKPPKGNLSFKHPDVANRPIQ